MCYRHLPRDCLLFAYWKVTFKVRRWRGSAIDCETTTRRVSSRWRTWTMASAGMGERRHRLLTERPPPDPSFLEHACPSFSHVFAADVTHLWLVGSALTSQLYLVSHVSPCCKHFALYLIPNHRWFVCQYSLIVSRQSPTPRSAARGRSSSALRPRSLSNSSSRCSNTVSFLMNLPFMFGILIERNWCRPVEAAAVVFSPDVDRPRNIFGTAPDGKIGRSCRLRTQRGESGGTSWPRPRRMSAHRT